MALSKTFASGAPLTAADVNAYLVERVPNTGDLVHAAAAGSTAAGIAGTIDASRAGLDVEITINATGTFAVGETQIGTVPAEFAPRTASRQGSALLSGAQTGVVFINSSGVITLRQQSGASRTAVLATLFFRRAEAA